MPPSPALPRGFVFLENPSDFRDPAALVIRLPRVIRSKQKLFAILADRLRFPGYFGWNWDALEECLQDLSWLSPNRRVVLVHESLPFGQHSENRETYLEILRDSLAERRTNSPPLSIVLPDSVRAEISPAAISPR